VIGKHTQQQKNRNKEAEPEVQAGVQMVKPKRKITKLAYLRDFV